MNKKNIGILFVILILVGILWFVFSKKSQTQNTSEVKQTSTTNDSESLFGESSFKDLLMSEKSQECNLSFEDDTKTKSEGTVYLSEKKMSGYFNTSSEGQNIKSNILLVNDTFYTWVDGMNAGYMFKQTEKPSNQNDKSSFNADQRVKFNCKPWKVDNTKFNLPSGVSFNNNPLEQLNTKSTQPSGNNPTTNTDSTDLKSQQCSACDQLPEESKMQCKVALGC